MDNLEMLLERSPPPTLPEIAKALGISRSAAYAAAKSGEIPTIRIGRRIIVRADAMKKKHRISAEAA